VDGYYRLLSCERTGKPEIGYRIEAAGPARPRLADPRVEDAVADGPLATVYYVVRHVEPNRALLLFTDTHPGYLVRARLQDNPRLGVFGEISDGYLLTEPEPGKTRVVRRMHLRCGALALQRVGYRPSCWSGAWSWTPARCAGRAPNTAAERARFHYLSA
jgi:hypothetical protein